MKSAPGMRCSATCHLCWVIYYVKDRLKVRLGRNMANVCKKIGDNMSSVKTVLLRQPRETRARRPRKATSEAAACLDVRTFGTGHDSHKRRGKVHGVGAGYSDGRCGDRLKGRGWPFDRSAPRMRITEEPTLSGCRATVSGVYGCR